jgi:hypothetical protein
MFAPNEMIAAAEENKGEPGYSFVFCRAKRIRINAAKDNKYGEIEHYA